MPGYPGLFTSLSIGWFARLIGAGWAGLAAGSWYWMRIGAFSGVPPPYPRCLSACRGQHWMGVQGLNEARRAAASANSSRSG
jgi:hypothetical protein